MLDILRFVFSSFWVWLGTVVLISESVAAVSILYGVVSAFQAMKGK